MNFILLSILADFIIYQLCGCESLFAVNVALNLTTVFLCSSRPSNRTPVDESVVARANYTMQLQLVILVVLLWLLKGTSLTSRDEFIRILQKAKFSCAANHQYAYIAVLILYGRCL